MAFSLSKALPQVKLSAWLNALDFPFRVWGGQLTEQQSDLLNIAWCFHRASKPATTSTDDLRTGFWANLSQSVQRKPWAEPPHTCCRSTVEYSFQLDKILSGFGQMRIMGHPANLDRSLFSNADFMELAGEGFSIPIAAMLIHAYWENPHAPWW